MIGRKLGHYEIVAKLGVGGMGEVYEGRDPRLGRRVAVKVLRDTVTANREAVRRFDREARAVAALSHPNICTLFDVGSEDGIPFLVMEYLPGDTLAERLRGRALPVEDVLRLGSQIAAAVAAAHAHNVVHRDLKPANVKITPAGAKVMDFGLAKFSVRPAEWDQSEAPTEFATGRHAVVGTAPYMSPEQASGDLVDHRTDCWSFGVVLYEMLTGRQLFNGDSSFAIISAVLSERLDLSTLPVTTPRAVHEMLSRLLERDRERRIGDMAGVAAALEHSLVRPTAESMDKRPGATSRSSQPAASIVVLPFANQSPDPENEYFSDGLTEEVIADLSKVNALRVISRTTAMRLKHTEQDLQAISRQLDVHYALEGSVRKVGNDLRITVQLVDVISDKTLWSDKYSGRLDEIFAIQERVSRAIVGALRLQLSESEDQRLRVPGAHSAFVYDTYLRARRDIWSFVPERLARAEAELKHALTIVGDDPLLHAGLGMVQWQYINGGISGDRRHLENAEQHARRVIEVDPMRAKGYQLLGLIAAQSGDALGWARHLERAINLDPHDPELLVWLAFAWTWSGFPHRSRPLYDRLQSIDPLFDYLHWGLGFEAYFASDYAEAERCYEKGRQLSPDHPGGVMCLVQTFASAGEIERMAHYAGEHAPEPSVHPLYTLTHVLKHAVLGEADAVDALCSSDLESKLWSDFQYTHIMAQAQAVLGRADEALRWLARSIERGNQNYPFLSERDPLLAGLRGDERFSTLMDLLRGDWESFESRVDST